MSFAMPYVKRKLRAGAGAGTGRQLLLYVFVVWFGSFGMWC